MTKMVKNLLFNVKILLLRTKIVTILLFKVKILLFNVKILLLRTKMVKILLFNVKILLFSVKILLSRKELVKILVLNIKILGFKGLNVSKFWFLRTEFGFMSKMIQHSGFLR